MITLAYTKFDMVYAKTLVLKVTAIPTIYPTVTMEGCSGKQTATASTSRWTEHVQPRNAQTQPMAHAYRIVDLLRARGLYKTPQFRNQHLLNRK